MYNNIKKWRFHGLIGIVLFVISIPFKIVEFIHINNSGGWYFIDIYLSTYNKLINIQEIILSSNLSTDLFGVVVSLLLFISSIFIIYSLLYNNVYVYFICGLVFSMTILYILHSLVSIGEVIVSVGLAFYLLSISSLFLLFASISSMNYIYNKKINIYKLNEIRYYIYSPSNIIFTGNTELINIFSYLIIIIY